MEHIVFAEYCKNNKVKELIPDDFSIEIKFENGETISKTIIQYNSTYYIYFNWYCFACFTFTHSKYKIEI